MSRQIRFRDKSRLAILRKFFSGENKISSQLSFRDEELVCHNNELGWLINRLDEQKMTALPYQTQESMAWMGFAGKDDALDDLTRVVTSFLIPSFGYNLKTEDTFDLKWLPFQRAKELLGQDYLKWSGEPETWTEAAKILIVGLELWDKQPPLIRSGTPTSFSILSKFRDSLLARDWAKSEALLKKIEEAQLVSSLNLAFLWIQLEESRGNWHGILEIKNLDDVVHAGPPRKVRLAVAKAFYFDKHEELEQKNDFRRSLNIFQKKQADLWTLLKSVEPGASWVTDRMLAYAAVLRDEQTLLEEILEQADAADKVALEEIRRMAPSAPFPPALEESLKERCLRLMNLGRFREAFQSARDLKYPESQRLMIIIASMAEDDELVKDAVSAYHKLHPKRQQELREDLVVGRMIEILDVPDKDTSVTDWIGWLQGLLDKPEKFGKLREVAGKLPESWIPSKLKVDQLDAFCEMILEASLSDDQRISSTFNECYPHLASSFLEEDKFPRLEFIDVYRQLFVVATEALTCSSNRALHTLRIAEGVIEIDPDFLPRLEAKYLPWIQNGAMTEKFSETVFEVMEVLAFKGISPEKLGNLWISAANFLNSLPSSNFSIAQVEVWKELGRFCGIGKKILTEYFPKAEEKPLKEEKNLQSRLTGKMVAIFTLMPEAAERVKKVLENRFSAVEVRINSDKGGTDQLRELAKNADLLLLVTQAMKHSAFNSIKQVADPKKIVYPEGRGSSSILRKIEESA
jgi:hypothetical protein